jgi:hypothetical protein
MGSETISDNHTLSEMTRGRRAFGRGLVFLNNGNLTVYRQGNN